MRRPFYASDTLEPIKAAHIGKISKKWWTGLDSNQRTENRADLQSAAFNHSATCPHLHAGHHVFA